jgi:threonine dehydratase
MPHDAPALKVTATQGYGAEVVRYDRYTEDREAIGAALARERGMAVVPPYDHPHVIAGQGTAVKELLEETGPLDVVVTPLGGGGLLSGSILAAGALAPDARVYGVEPASGDDARRSLEEGRIVHIDTPRTIADGAQTQHLGELTFPIIRDGVTAILTATDEQLVDAMRVVASTLKQVVEPTAVLGLAAVLSGAVPEIRGLQVGVVLTGGNIDLNRFAELLATPR